MGRKKNLKGIDEADIELIDSKMGYNTNDRATNYITPLKSFEYKINIKCKNKKQKEFLNILKDESKIICFGIGMILREESVFGSTITRQYIPFSSFPS